MMTDMDATATATNYQTRLGLSFAPSSFQAAIFEAIESGRGHLVIEAVAGSGKSSTLIAAAGLIEGQGLFLAFNKTIATHLASKLAGTSMVASTVHSHGFSAVRANVPRVKLDSKKYSIMVAGAEDAAMYRGSVAGVEITETMRAALDADGFPRKEIIRLIDLARLDVLDIDAAAEFDEDLLLLADRHNLDFAPSLDSIVCAVVRRCLVMGADQVQTIDFTDMVWLPVVCGWRPRQYSWVFVDECQDISRAALALIRRSVRAGGRMLFVGDRRQAIYGFCGADAQSFQTIIEQTSATLLPLSVCYRCPTSVLERARVYCPQILAREGAPEGVVRRATRDDYVSEAREGDLVLCRRNAPLLGLCFELIAEGIPAVVRGRDIATGLVKIVRTITRNRDFARFPELLELWLAGQSANAKMRSKDQDALASKLDALADKAEAISIIAARSGAKSAEDLCRAIADMFSDERGSMTLSSVHKAKGLEAERVALLEPERLGFSPRARQEWQQEQEENIAYVAYSRAMAEIIEIDDDAQPTLGKRDEDAGDEPEGEPNPGLLVTREIMTRAQLTAHGEDALRPGEASDAALIGAIVH